MGVPIPQEQRLAESWPFAKNELVITSERKKSMDTPIEKFDLVRVQAERFYQSLSPVWCPYLGDAVHFNAEGFEHLLFKSWNRNRSKKEQYTRLRLFSCVPEIISKPHTLQEYDERVLPVRQKINSRWEQRIKRVRYYVFIAIIKTVRLKIVIKEIEGGKKFFWSLYPSWKERNEEGKIKKIFYSGDLEED